jgi:sugar O-acyltransferase (sialic acid O-acetyltransferase NeuD family)
MIATQKASVVIVGQGGHARVIADTCRAAGITVHGYIVEGRPAGARSVEGVILGGDACLDDPALRSAYGFIVGIGGVEKRRSLTKRILGVGGTLTSVIHPSAIIGGEVELAAGTLIFAGAVSQCGCVMAAGVIINTGARVDHECRLGEGVHVCPGATLGGEVTVGDWTVIGPGVTIVKGVSVGPDTVIGAGSVVLGDMPGGVTAYGVPCRVKK